MSLCRHSGFWLPSPHCLDRILPANCLSDGGWCICDLPQKSVITSHFSRSLFCVKSAGLVYECLIVAFFYVCFWKEAALQTIVSFSLKNSFKPEILKTASGLEIEKREWFFFFSFFFHKWWIAVKEKKIGRKVQVWRKRNSRFYILCMFFVSLCVSKHFCFIKKQLY